MIVLDTNVISALMQDAPHPAVTAWLNGQPIASVWTTAITLFEVQFGLDAMAAGRNRRALQRAFDGLVQQDLGGRVLDLDGAAARRAAGIAAKLRAIGRRGEVRDLLIAGTVAARGATLATRNTKDFTNAGIPLVDPWAQATP